MQNPQKILKTAAFIGAISLYLSACQAPNQRFHPLKTNHFGQNFHQPGRYRPSQKTYKRPRKYKNIASRLRGEKHISYQTPPPPPGPLGQFQQWFDYEPEYRLYPNDQLDVIVPSAPELSRTLTIGPDGRVVMPMVEPIMAAGKTVTQVKNEIKAGLARQLRDSTVTVTSRSFAPQQIFIGGQVQTPGTYTLPGPIGTIESVFMAGGFSPGARSTKVAVLRRAPNGAMMMRTVDLQNGLRNIREYDDNIQLRRGDIVFVPKTNLAEVGAFVQAIRQTLPVDFNVSYTLGNFGGGGGNNAIGPAVTAPIINP